MEILSWLFFILFIGALIVVGGLLLKGYIRTGSPTSALTGAITGAFFGPKPEKRLEVMDQFNVDGRRRLVLIRRDDVEHLIMTGGPVDVVIETGIGSPAAALRPDPVLTAESPAPAPTQQPRQAAEFVDTTNVFSRAPRTFGQAAGEG
ncbi:MAG: hypothetical protein ACOYLQ_06515 [Hyphomicrobiaceae bacterium]